MLIRVDLPAPFSPMMPWIEPFATESETSLLAWTGPKCLFTPDSAMAGAAPPEAGPAPAVGLWSTPSMAAEDRKGRRQYLHSLLVL